MMLVFVNYAHFIKKKLQKLCFYFLLQIWEKHVNNCAIDK